MDNVRIPNYDDEQIAKYGLFAHLSAVSRGLRGQKDCADQARKKSDAELVERVLAQLTNPSEETSAQVAVAVPLVVDSASLKGVAIPDLRKVIAIHVYCDSCKRAGSVTDVTPLFDDLSLDEQKSFFEIVEAVMVEYRSIVDARQQRR